MADPWYKFYPTDWQSDPALRMCNLAARGLWIEMLCLMHKAHPYGHLLVNGQSPTDTQLGVLVGAPPDQVAAMLGDLEIAGVFSRTRAGVIYSRKMSRMAKMAASARKNGRKGGNPSLRKETGNSSSDNPPDKVRDKTQKPEARSQSKEREAKASQKKASRLSENWVLPDNWRTWSISEGMPDDAVKREAERFRDYWISVSGQKGVKLDWQATWRNWSRKWIEDNPKQANVSSLDKYRKYGR